MRKCVEKRLTLIRTCAVCGRTFPTTAEGWHRIIKSSDGWHTDYYCKESCKRKSYKYDMYANQVEKRLEKDRRYAEKHKEQKKAYNKRYYAEHAEEEKARHREYYKNNRDEILEINRYNKKKRKVMESV